MTEKSIIPITILLTTFFFLGSVWATDDKEKIEDAVKIIQSSRIEKQLLAATKIIVDSNDEVAWLVLITHLNNKELMLKKGALVGVKEILSPRQIHPNFYKYFDVIYNSTNKNLLGFLAKLGESPSYVKNRHLVPLFALNLMRYENKDERFFDYIVTLSSIKYYSSLQDLLILSGKEKYHHVVLIQNGYTPGQVVFKKEVKIEDFYNSENLEALGRYRDVPYNFQCLVNLHLRWEGDKHTKKENRDSLLEYVLDDEKEYLFGMDSRIPFAIIDPKTLEDCKAYEKILFTLKGKINTLKYRNKFNSLLKKIQDKISKQEAKK